MTSVAMRAAALLACAAAYAPRWHRLGVPPKPLAGSVRGLAGRYASSRRSAAAEPDPQQTSRLAAALKPARGPLDNEIAAVALPAMLSLAVFPVVGMVDTFFVGRMGSALSLAGQGAANAAEKEADGSLASEPRAQGGGEPRRRAPHSEGAMIRERGKLSCLNSRLGCIAESFNRRRIRY